MPCDLPRVGSIVNKSPKSSIFKASLMAMLLAGACGAQGAGLGTLSVFSGIGQQLNAEVALNATPAELGTISAKLASPEAFKEAGIEYMPVLSDLRIRIEKSATGQPVLKLTTVRPVTEPFLHFLVELSWGSGRVIREYTFLLDPPEMLQVAKPASVVAPAAPAIKPLSAPAAAKAAAPVPSVTKPAPPVGSEYQVKPGDTLGKIARETRPDSVTLDQMLVALFDNNPDAFAGGNMNRLRAGKILRIPAAEEAAKVDPAAARKLVIHQTSEFAAYRRRLAGTVAAAPAVTAVPQQQVSGAIKPRLEDAASGGEGPAGGIPHGTGEGQASNHRDQQSRRGSDRARQGAARSLGTHRPARKKHRESQETGRDQEPGRCGAPAAERSHPARGGSSQIRGAREERSPRCQGRRTQTGRACRTDSGETA
jgi:pilus assembly protein FimV